MSSVKRELEESAEIAAENYFGKEMMAGVETRWGSGVSGNPNGRPKDPDNATLTEWLIHVLGKTGAKSLAQELIAIAKTPGATPTKLAAIQYIYDRIEGRPRQAVTTTTQDEHPLISLFRKVTDDSKALEGRVVRSLPASTLYETLSREGAGEDAGSEL